MIEFYGLPPLPLPTFSGSANPTRTPAWVKKDGDEELVFRTAGAAIDLPLKPL